MKTKSSYRKIVQGLAIVISLFGTIRSAAQTLVTGPLSSGALPPGSYYGLGSVVMSPGFNVNGSTGSYRFYISTDCYTLTTSASAGQNFIQTSIPRTGGIQDVNGLVNRSTCELMQTVQYFDGLGRPLQTVSVKGSPLGKDIVIPQAYDPFGREVAKYLPYVAVTGDGSYKTNALTAGQGQGAFYASPPAGIPVISYPSSSTVFEASPMNRVLEQGAPGVPWQLSGSGITGSGHTIKTGYGNNVATDIPLWKVNGAGNGATGGNSYYGAAQLYATTITNENGYNSIEYKDKEGRIICKKVQLGTSPVSYLATSYIYDDLDNLTYVIPPLPAGTTYPSSFVETDAVFANFMYGYHYDERKRVVQKKIPGKGFEYNVYNQLNQVVLAQDSIQRRSNQWTVTKYDALGRVIITGLWNAGSSISQAALQASIYAGVQWDNRDNTNLTTGYNLTSYPSLSKVLTINYYDDYGGLPGLPSAFVSSGNSTMTKGLLTATRTTVLNTVTNITPDMLYAIDYYDDFGRNVLGFRQHYLGGSLSPYNYDMISNTYDFNNELISTTRQHYTKNSANTAAVLGVTIANTYAYDHLGRKSSTTEQINNGSKVLLSDNDYNEVGQLMTRHLHSANDGASFLQNISYSYNERGWLTKINDPSVAATTTSMFSEQLNYNVQQYGAIPQYNGNIAEQVFAIYNSTNGGHTAYAYDPLNRLNSGTASTGLSETGITYDNLGNILTLKRGTASVSSYTYNGNQLTTVSGVTGSNYVYDANGNAIHDGRLNATITYNLLNLPQTITAAGVNITYTYDAAGNKLRKVSSSTPTDYISGIQYKADASTIDFIQTEEGRALNTGTGYNYEYTLKDYLGNNRVTFDQTNGKVTEDDYYPFGMNQHRLVNAVNNYLYNSKELQNEINEYDFGARFYDPVIARWNTIDPHSEKYESISSYSYAFNNPNRFIDIKGYDPGDIVIIFTGANIASISQKADPLSTDRIIKNLSPLRKDFVQIVKYRTQYEIDVKESVGDALEAIAHSKKLNPNAKVVIYGYSYGGVLANYLAKKLDEENVSVDLLITIDAANSWKSGSVDRKISKNVKKNLNFYEKNLAHSALGIVVNSGGDANSGADGQVNNTDMSNDNFDGQSIDHASIDDATVKSVSDAILKLFFSVKDGEHKSFTGKDLNSDQ